MTTPSRYRVIFTNGLGARLEVEVEAESETARARGVERLAEMELSGILEAQDWHVIGAVVA